MKSIRKHSNSPVLALIAASTAFFFYADSSVGQTLEERVTQNESDIVKLFGVVGDNATDITTLGNRVDGHSGEISNLSSRVGSLEYEVSRHYSYINNIGSTASYARSQAEDAYALARENEDDISTLFSITTDLQNNKVGRQEYSSFASYIEREASAARDQAYDAWRYADRNETRISSLELDVNGLGTRVTDLQTQVNGFQAAIDHFSADVPGLQAAMGLVQDRVSTLEQEFGRIDILELDTVNNAQDIASLGVRLDEMDASNASWRNTVNEHSLNIVNNSNRISGLDTRVTDLENGLTTQVDGLAQEVAQNTSDIAISESEINALQVENDEQWAAIGQNEAEINALQIENGEQWDALEAVFASTQENASTTAALATEVAEFAERVSSLEEAETVRGDELVALGERVDVVQDLAETNFDNLGYAFEQIGVVSDLAETNFDNIGTAFSEITRIEEESIAGDDALLSEIALVSATSEARDQELLAAIDQNSDEIRLVNERIDAIEEQLPQLNNGNRFAAPPSMREFAEEALNSDLLAEVAGVNSALKKEINDRKIVDGVLAEQIIIAQNEIDNTNRQVEVLGSQVMSNTSRIESLEGGMRHLKSEVYSAVAGVSAMAAIPAAGAGNYSVGVGYGNYGGENAAALGASYRDKSGAHAFTFSASATSHDNGFAAGYAFSF